MDNERLQSIALAYVRRAWLWGICLYLVPTLLIFAYMLSSDPWRDVYGLRLALALLVGSPIAGILHHRGIALWSAKHRSDRGPGTVLDGMWIGGAAGFYMSLAPPLFSLIGTNHLEEAKWFIIAMYLIMTAAGAVLGGIIAAVGGKYLPRK